MLNLHKNNTFVITLGGSRYQRMVRRMESINMKHTIWNATKPNEIFLSFNESLNVHQKACAQSHILLWKFMINNDLEYILIMEDDIVFHNSFIDKIKQFNEHGFLALFLNASEEITPKNEFVKVTEQYLTGAYVLRKAGAMELLRLFSNEYHSSDWMTSRLQLLGNCWSHFPWLCIQENKDSLIGSNSSEDHKKVVRLLGKELKEYYTTCFVLVTDRCYFSKMLNTIKQLREVGKWKGDIVVIAVGFKMLPLSGIIVKQFDQINTTNLISKIPEHGFINSDKRELNKTNQWEKLHVFDNYFRRWDRVCYLDSGMNIYSDIGPLLELDHSGKFLCPCDAGVGKYHNDNAIFTFQIDHSDQQLVKKLIGVFGKEILISDYFLNCMWVYDTYLLNFTNKEYLITLMNEYPLCRTNEMVIMNLVFNFKLKVWKPFPEFCGDGNERILFEWSDLCRPGTSKNDYIFLKYPSIGIK